MSGGGQGSAHLFSQAPIKLEHSDKKKKQAEKRSSRCILACSPGHKVPAKVPLSSDLGALPVPTKLFSVNPPEVSEPFQSYLGFVSKIMRWKQFPVVNLI